jgi:hypothetical protein
MPPDVILAHQTTAKHQGGTVKEMLDSRQAGEYLRLAVQTLAKYRVEGTGPAFYKVGRSVLYDRTDLDAFLSTRRRRSTSDRGTENQRLATDAAL